MAMVIYRQIPIILLQLILMEHVAGLFPQLLETNTSLQQHAGAGAGEVPPLGLTKMQHGAFIIKMQVPIVIAEALADIF